MVKKLKKKRNGVWCPEDRLQGVYISSLFLVPLSVAIAGLTMTYVEGPVGLAICLICLLTNGMGVSRLSYRLGNLHEYPPGGHGNDRYRFILC